MTFYEFIIFDPYQYKRELLRGDEVNRLISPCETFDDKFVVWALLDTGLR
jgi:integrase/recombinase XerD